MAITLAAAASASAEQHRHWLAAQHDFAAKRGFYLNFENSSEGAAPCRLETLRLILGVGDGAYWRFIVGAPGWRLDHDYAVRAVIGPDTSELWLDGAIVGRSPGRFVPDTGLVTMDSVPGWASGRAEYMVRQSDIGIAAGDQKLVRGFAGPSPISSPLSLFTSSAGETAPLRLVGGATVTIEAHFRLARYPSLRELSPFIDRYGQSVHSTWTGKIRTDADLKHAARDERTRLAAMAPPRDFDRYGGYLRAGWKQKGAGFFRVVKRGGRWWFVTPQGNPCFYLGVCGVPMLSWEMTPVTGREFLFGWLPPKPGPFAAAWATNQWGGSDGTEYVAFHTANMIRKYGDAWAETSRTLGAQRMRAWAFSGGGKWDRLAGAPYVPVLGRDGVPNLVRHPDVFDPAIVGRLRDWFFHQIASRKNDPMVVGWSVGNEFDEIVTTAEIVEIVAKPSGTPARRAMLDHLLATTYGGDRARLANAWSADPDAASAKPGDADLETMRRFYEDAYYACIYEAVKKADPNHLYLGNWIVPNWWQNEEDWRIVARHCDVIGYDRYAPTFADAQLDRLLREANKPVFCGEFSFPPTYRGTRGFGVYPTSSTDDANAGDLYARWVEAAARNPYCVGGAWFMYRDQPLTGRGPGRGDELIYGEHYAFGLVDVADRPKWDVVTRMRKANLGAATVRMQR